MASETAQWIDHLIHDYVHPLLKERGFRRRGRTWNRRFDELVQIVNVQASARNFGNFGRFFINIGISVPGLPHLGPHRDGDQFISERFCQLRLRIGQLMPTPVHAWHFYTSDNPDEVGCAVADALVAYGLPFLDQCMTLKDLDEYLDRNDLLFHFHATLTAYLGHRDEARRILLQASQVDASYQRAACWTAERLGIDLGPVGESAKSMGDG